MKCVICHGSGPFSVGAFVLDESKPICDKCAAAMDVLSAYEENISEWEKSFYWLYSAQNGIVYKDVLSYVLDALDAAKSSPNYVKVEKQILARERVARLAEEIKHDAEVAPYNAKYEYAVEAVSDTPDGRADILMIGAVVSNYASKGWRLHKTMVKETGKKSPFSGAGGKSAGTNAAADQTILIFERCVKPIA